MLSVQDNYSNDFNFFLFQIVAISFPYFYRDHLKNRVNTCFVRKRLFRNLEIKNPCNPRFIPLQCMAFIHKIFGV